MTKLCDPSFSRFLLALLRWPQEVLDVGMGASMALSLIMSGVQLPRLLLLNPAKESCFLLFSLIVNNQIN